VRIADDECRGAGLSLHRHVSGLFALEDAIDVACHLSELVNYIDTVGDQALTQHSNRVSTNASLRRRETQFSRAETKTLRRRQQQLSRLPLRR
jgi:hypothetical protein